MIFVFPVISREHAILVIGPALRRRLLTIQWAAVGRSVLASNNGAYWARQGQGYGASCRSPSR